MQVCHKCGQQMIDVNGTQECIHCVASKSVVPKGAPKQFTEKDERAMDRMFQSVPYTGLNKTAVLGKAEMVVTGSSVADALGIMKRLPMPKDVKDFKKIQKIITQMEALLGEDNDAA